MTFMGAVLWFAAPVLIGWMTSVSEVIDLATTVLRIEAWAEPMFAAAIVSYGVFVGAGGHACARLNEPCKHVVCAAHARAGPCAVLWPCGCVDRHVH